jgi:hypothetical protein
LNYFGAARRIDLNGWRRRARAGDDDARLFALAELVIIIFRIVAIHILKKPATTAKDRRAIGRHGCRRLRAAAGAAEGFNADAHSRFDAAPDGIGERCYGVRVAPPWSNRGANRSPALLNKQLYAQTLTISWDSLF